MTHTCSNANQPAQIAAMKAAAASRNVPFLDADIDSLPKIGDGVHPTLDGHRTLADTLAAEIAAIPTVKPGTLLGYKVWDGTDLRDVTGWKFYDGTDLTTARVERLPSGYDTSAAMLAQEPFYIAHRGGSKDYPEHSLLAYTQAVRHEFGALELALARTSDGVWFGLHDDSLDRTSLGTGGGTGTQLVASQMTWAEVQQYVINLPAGTSGRLPQPYMRWEEYVETYYASHVTFIDIKAAFSHRTELLNMMDALPGNPRQRFVAKYYGKQYGGWAQDASARGYKTWGYFYAGDGATIDQWADKWDILGLSYDAPAGDWSSFVGTGKPVVGHICPDQAAADTALAKGAAGLMVSGVTSVDPT
ncbi:hypothetical protein GCM10025865_01390 [Paraoerskovia sediminicola]|uniref:GP-PDE domain-containing protein n=1 Tax=Paraoerskovia sediminicola TaxID=1138587 RepID=A0ABN6X7R0_9CELL|nr:glycerophosphodiester phosphodiesterase family protein [Paraoerskovia sediminicola]BDZ40840.1 hypothetical protein GCM10025865_01390 [Paraoerskovia sediminicola]